MIEKKYDPWTQRTEFAEIANIKNMYLIDIGTGRGYSAIIFARDYGCKVVSIDTKENKLLNAEEEAQKYSIEQKIQFRRADITSTTSFNDNQFQAAVILNTLHHIPDEKKVSTLKEIARITREKISIGELNEKGAEYFDTIAHPNENHRRIMVKKKWLLDQLGEFGDVNVVSSELIDVFSCVLK